MDALFADLHIFCDSTLFSILCCAFLIFSIITLGFQKLIRSRSHQREDILNLQEIPQRLAMIKKKYSLTDNGFLPLSCVQRLPCYYEEWERIVDKLPDLNKSKKIKEAVENMELLSCKLLENDAMIYRAFVILGMIVHSYINGEDVFWEPLLKKNGLSDADDEQKINKNQENLRKVPPQLAIPWFIVCKKLDLPFILTAGLDLWNWKLKDSSKPVTLSNLSTISSMTGTTSEEYFHLVPCAMQAVAGPVIPRLFTFHELLSAGSKDILICFIHDVGMIFKEFKVILKEIFRHVDKNVFYDVYRPLLAGFWPKGIVLQLHEDHKMIKKGIVDDFKIDNNSSNGLLNGNIDINCKFSEFYAGIDEKDDTKRFKNVIKNRLENGNLLVNPKGPSAGQSTMFILFDLLLGIQHWGTGKEFQSEMLDYMPSNHRQIAIDFKELILRKGSLRDIVLKARNADAVVAFNECINSVADFRAMHLGIALKYLARTKLGTGSSSFRNMLDEMIKGTKNAMISY